jgi:hypothetical protein
MSAQETMNTTTKKAANSIVGKLTALILAGAAADPTVRGVRGDCLDDPTGAVATLSRRP